jgi:hypothetical protein
MMKKIKVLTEFSICIAVILFSCDRENPVSHSDCKSFSLKSIAGSCEYGSDSSCICYDYNSQVKKLIIKHVNAGFNCCPGEIYCDIDIDNDTIFLKESEEKAECNCDCLYDVEIVVSDIEKHKYVINLNEPYSGDQERIVFDIDLTKNETGVFCMERKQYPWGI